MWVSQKGTSETGHIVHCETETKIWLFPRKPRRQKVSVVFDSFGRSRGGQKIFLQEELKLNRSIAKEYIYILIYNSIFWSTDNKPTDIPSLLHQWHLIPSEE